MNEEIKVIEINAEESAAEEAAAAAEEKKTEGEELAEAINDVVEATKKVVKESKKAAKKATAEVKKAAKKATAESKDEVTKALKESSEEVKAAAKKASAEVKKATEEVKTAAKRTRKVKTAVTFQLAGKDYTEATMAEQAKQVWTEVLEREAKDLKQIEMYVKPEDKKVYCVFNGDTTGSFDL